MAFQPVMNSMRSFVGGSLSSGLPVMTGSIPAASAQVSYVAGSLGQYGMLSQPVVRIGSSMWSIDVKSQNGASPLSVKSSEQIETLTAQVAAMEAAWQAGNVQYLQLRERAQTDPSLREKAETVNRALEGALIALGHVQDELKAASQQITYALKMMDFLQQREGSEGRFFPELEPAPPALNPGYGNPEPREWRSMEGLHGRSVYGREFFTGDMTHAPRTSPRTGPF